MIWLRAIAGVVFAVALALAAVGASAGNIDALYDDATLKFWQTKYARGLNSNLENVIFPRLSAEESRRLAGVRIEVPLRVQDQEPFAYYTTGTPWVVTMSAASLKFFDDFCVAIAWLQTNGYGIETASDYVSMLKYRTPGAVGGRYPLPLDALQIPGNALDNRRVDTIANQIFNEAIFFVLAHELGHVLYRHPGYGPGVTRAEARANEAEADAFALDMIQRVEAEPTSMAFWFLMTGHMADGRGDFASDAEYEEFLAESTHPLTGDRIAALADRLMAAAEEFARNETDQAASLTRIQWTADQLQQVAGILGDPEIQALIANRGRSMTPAMLAPRRSDQLPGAGPAAATAGLAAFHGTYQGEFSDGTANLPINTVLRRDGDQVTGEYYYGAGAGQVVGLIQDGTFYFQWQEGDATGYGYLETADGGETVSGRWGRGESMDDGGTWRGKRTGP
ncbi:MAG TPA: M48 family metalloprotease [Dongiaceae bacterium]|nr:M48 family metalloprotease [Dongiaceae bacterium]